MQLETIRPAKNPEREFRTKLIKAMSAKIVTWTMPIEQPVSSDQMHEIKKCLREIENMFQRPSIGREIKVCDQVWWKGLPEVVNDRSALVIRNVDTLDRFKFQRFLKKSSAG